MRSTTSVNKLEESHVASIFQKYRDFKVVSAYGQIIYFPMPKTHQHSFISVQLAAELKVALCT